MSTIVYSRFTNEILALAKEQRCLITYKSNRGILLKMPTGKTVHFIDPGNDSHDQKVIRVKLKHVGFELEDDDAIDRISRRIEANTMTKPNGQHSPASAIKEPQSSTISQIRQNLTAASDLIAESVGLLDKLEVEQDCKLAAAKKVLDAFAALDGLRNK